MELLIRLFGPPHEALHALALLLIGRRARAVARGHIDIPDDLSTRQFVFVAGLPAAVFWGAAGLGALALVGAPTLAHAALALIFTGVMAIAGAGTLGDVHLILLRLERDRRPPA